MRNAWHIAVNTFREAVREKVLYVILFFAFLMVVASRAIGWVSVGQQEQVVKDLSLAVISLFGALIAVFVGTVLIYKETDKRTIYTILSKPVQRWQFLLGKFLGLGALLACLTAAMGLMVGAFVAFAIGGTVDLLFAKAILLIAFELLVVTSLAVLFSTLASPVLSALFTFSAYLVGQVTPSLLDLVRYRPLTEEQLALKSIDGLNRFLSLTHEFLTPLARAAYYILPNLTYFSLRNRVVHGPDMSADELLAAVLYALCYSAAVLAAAALLFDRKRL